MFLHSAPAANAHVAQLVEHVLGKDEVTGSIPVEGSSYAEMKTPSFMGREFFIKEAKNG